jgi:hypothetical protein
MAIKGGVVPATDTQYFVAGNSGVSENLPMDSRFAQKMSRGAMGNPNMFVSADKQVSLGQYVKAAKWTKDERIVFGVMQDLMDKTGAMPTVGQIVQVSSGRSVASSSGGMHTMSVADTSLDVPIGNLNTARVQRALDKLQKKGIVSQMV